MGRKRQKERPLEPYVVVSYIDGQRRINETDAYSYRDAKRRVARFLREELGMWDTNLSDITRQGLMMARKLAPKVF